MRELKILDPAVGSGHFLVVAFDLLVALYREEAAHRGESWSDAEIVESILANNLHGIDLDPRAVQVAAAALWLEAQQVAPGARPKVINLVASQLRLAGLDDDDPARVELREAVERETGISARLTNEVVHALEGADHLGSLLKVGDALDRAVRAQGSLLERREGGSSGDADAERAKERLVAELEGFLARHTGSADLGLRLRGEQLAAGVRFLRLVEEGRYDLVVGNPPYQGTSKMVDATYVAKAYPKGKADLFAAFLERGLELVREGGVSALLTMRNWMFIKQYAKLREWLISECQLRAIGDVSWGAFREMKDNPVTMSVIAALSPGAHAAAIAPTDPQDRVRTREEFNKKISGLLCQVGRHDVDPAALKVVPEWPLVYWWDEALLLRYGKAHQLGDLAPCKVGIVTGNNPRFTRKHGEVGFGKSWVPYVTGAKGARWLEPCDDRIKWSFGGLEEKVMAEAMYGSYSRQIRGEELYFKIGIACATIGNSFGARFHRRPAIIGSSAASVYPCEIASTLAFLNSSFAQNVLSSLNPGLHFEIGDINRLPYAQIDGAESILSTLENSFTTHESHREPSVEYLTPGPSPWRHAQAWAQAAVDRPENTPLPPYTEHLDPEPNTDHISYALGVALGRFGAEGLTTKRGILDPTQDDLTHALPDGILFLDGTLDPDSAADALGHGACALLLEKWQTHPPQDSKRDVLRDYLRLDFFADVHRKMYENRPIHWPLSSAKKTFVAWVTIHRLNAQTLRRLLVDHLHPARLRLEGKIDDLRAVANGPDKKAARAADKALPKLEKLLAELVEFIADVSLCAERGPESAFPKDHPKTDAIYDPDLDDGVMINSAALWPLLQPQWKDPQKWWKELCAAKGRKDYDWSHLAARYFPARVEGKCKRDPSLGVAHGCFWRYHPERAYAWELRLQDEIAPDFTIDEDWSAKLDADAGETKNSDEAREGLLRDHPQTAKEIRLAEDKRRERKHSKQQQQQQQQKLFPDDSEDTEDADD